MSNDPFFHTVSARKYDRLKERCEKLEALVEPAERLVESLRYRGAHSYYDMAAHAGSVEADIDALDAAINRLKG
jgi:hypothetical protein